MLTAMNLIGKNIDRLLKAKGWNQAKLAEKVDKPSSRVSELITKKGANPRLDTLQKVAYAILIAEYGNYCYRNNPKCI